MNEHHETLLQVLETSEATKLRAGLSANYIGSDGRIYGVATPVLRENVKQWLSQNPQLSPEEAIHIVHSLMAGESHEERKMASMILGQKRQVRSFVSTDDLDAWLSGLRGWAEVDSLCQSLFTVKEILGSWDEWAPFLRRLSKDELTEKRRASLVFLVMPVRKSNDLRLHDMALENIDELIFETDILITKAISWLLRSMIVTDKVKVANFLEANLDSLPKIAIRETRKVLETGKKT